MAVLGTEGPKILTIDEVFELPDPVWQIEGLIEAGALACVFGAPGEGKSFLTLDWALCVATGIPWNGRKVTQGSVVYIAAEGGRGIKKRVRAWQQRHGLSTITDFYLILEPVGLHEEAGALLTSMKNQGVAPSMLVVDTVARTFSGDENSTADMSAYIDAAQQVQEGAGPQRCTALLVHHSGKRNKGEARGSSALLAGVDVMISVQKSGETITVRNPKQKEGEEFGALALTLKPVVIGSSVEGDPITSCVLEGRSGPKPVADVLNANHRTALAALRQVGSATTGDWRKATANLLGRDVPDNTFEKWRKSLVMAGCVSAPHGTLPLRYVVTDKGSSAIGAPSSAKDMEPSSVSHATTPEGVGGRAGAVGSIDVAA